MSPDPCGRLYINLHHTAVVRPFLLDDDQFSDDFTHPHTRCFNFDGKRVNMTAHHCQRLLMVFWKSYIKVPVSVSPLSTYHRYLHFCKVQCNNLLSMSETLSIIQTLRISSHLTHLSHTKSGVSSKSTQLSVSRCASEALSSCGVPIAARTGHGRRMASPAAARCGAARESSWCRVSRKDTKV